LHLHAPSLAVFWGKWLVNTLLLLGLMLLTTLAFGLLTGLRVDNLPLLVVVLVVGGLGLSSTTTTVGAIIAQAATRSALFAALAIPVLFPLLGLLVQTTERAILGGTFADALDNIVGIGSYAVL